MELITRNFGKIEIQEEKTIVFKEGIPGFEELKVFILIEDKESKFCYLQSTENGDICFVMIDPFSLVKDYKPVINENYFEKLGGGNDDQFAIYNIVCLIDPIEESTINLAGPLLIHVGNKQGVQVITEDKTYTTKHKISELLKERG